MVTDDFSTPEKVLALEDRIQRLEKCLMDQIEEEDRALKEVLSGLADMRGQFDAAVMSRVAELRAKDHARIELAGRVMQAWCPKCPDYKSFVEWQCAEDCFLIADAMLAKADEKPNA